MCMGRKMKANKSMLFASIIIMILCQISTVNSENTGFQEQPGFNEKRVLSFDRPTLFMFGEQTAGPVNEWPTWNHANNADEGNSDNLFSEDGLIVPGIKIVDIILFIPTKLHIVAFKVF